MRHRRWLAAALLLLLLTACSVPAGTESTGDPALPPLSGPGLSAPTEAESVPTASVSPAESASETQALSTGAPTAFPTEPSLPPEPPSSEPPPVTEPPATEPPVTEPPAAESERPAVLSLGLYEGPYPEDGSDEPVDSVAVILVENRSEVQLQFAELHYEIDGREALFRISELPPGTQAMVLEQNRLIATPVSVWTPAPEEELYIYTPAAPEDRLELQPGENGKLSVVNRGDRTASFDLIYKQRGEDGVFVGGIAYHVAIPALEPGESRTLEAPHFTERSVPVRITAKEP